MKHLLNFLGLAAMVAVAVNPISIFAQAAPAPAAGGQPKIQFSEIAFDFGKVMPSDACKHEFVITNTGSAPLEITAVQPGCGCTTAGTWDKRIEPGKTGRIPIQFNPGNFSGHVSKGVTVTCNDPAQATHYLQISATIWRPIEVQPQFAYFMPVIGEETNETKIIRIVNNKDDDLKLETPQCASQLFKTEIKTVRPGKEFELHVTYAGPVSNAPPQGNISIKTSSTNMPVINVNAVAMTQNAITAFPTPIQLAAGPLKTDHQQSLTVRNNSRTPLKITNPTVNADGVTARVQDIEPGKVAMVAITFPSGFQTKAGQPVELSFNTAHPKHPVIKVPIIQLPPPAAATAPQTGAVVPQR